MPARRNRRKSTPARRKPPSPRPASNARGPSKRDRTLRAFLRSERSGAAALRELRIPITWLHLLVGIVLLLPLAWITTSAFFETFVRMTREGGFWRTEEFWFFSLGALLWLVAHVGLRGLDVVYVFGHEMTHAIFAMLSGGRLGEAAWTSEGGYIETDTSNWLVSLSPYFVPFYSVLSVSLFSLLQLWLPVPEATRWLFSLIGCTWCFHLSYTLLMLTRTQPDLKENGTVFSLLLIYFVNLLVLTGLLLLVSPSLDATTFLSSWLDQGQAFSGQLLAWLGL
ncbi:MAG: hypothetical protein AAF555_08255 [Verrucomicrobiota bacterium]